MIQHVVTLCAEDQLGFIVKGLGLLEDDIGIDKARPIKLVSMDRDVLVEGGIGKSRRRRTCDHSSRGDSAPSRRIGLADKRWPVEQTGVQVIPGSAQVERKTGLCLFDSGELDSLKEMSEEAVVEMAFSISNGKIVDGSDRRAMSNVGIGVPVFGTNRNCCGSPSCSGDGSDRTLPLSRA